MQISKITLSLMFTLLAGTVLHAEEPYQARVYKTADGQELNYRLMLPDGYKADGTESYPLVLFLHGAGERGSDNAKQLKHGAPEFSTQANRRKYPCFVVAPQCPQGKFWTQFDSVLRELLASLQKEFRVDAKRLYATGLSMGGFGTWGLITKSPELFAAAAPICGGGDDKLAEKLVKLPIWVFHGDQDNVVKPEQSRKMVSAIEKAGGKPKYTEYPGVGHDSWTKTYADPEFMSWLFQQKRP